MKLSNLLIIVALFFAVQLSTSCSGTSSETKMENIDKSGPEYASAYVCPMHCEGSGSDAPGKCPVCGMDYVENKDIKSSDGHDHDGHDHGDHDGHDH